MTTDRFKALCAEAHRRSAAHERAALAGRSDAEDLRREAREAWDAVYAEAGWLNSGGRGPSWAKLGEIAERHGETMRRRYLEWARTNGTKRIPTYTPIEGEIKATSSTPYHEAMLARFLTALAAWVERNPGQMPSANVKVQDDQGAYSLGRALFNHKVRARDGRIRPDLYAEIERLLGPDWDRPIERDEFLERSRSSSPG